MTDISALEYPSTPIAVPSLNNLGPAVFRLLAEVDDALDRNAVAARQGLAQLQDLLHGLPGFHHEPSAKARDSQPARGGLAPWQMRQVADFVGANLDSRIQVEDLAERARLSGSHFCRAFKVTTGETPHAYVMRRRLEHAQEMMVETEESLCHIADACGLADQAHLTRLFRRHAGVTPFQWRRLNRRPA
ncbi:AraC family transcriptional regulator [Brevundimonas sp.]|uniref:AraC family transcriptional regulator n=1 Tax=Brevundimonas sp. TaxID=1871086 RepID=UPI0028A17AAD|nr:AraC family transcriptional regulator [Brevundimonas sp.]